MSFGVNKYSAEQYSLDSKEEFIMKENMTQETDRKTFTTYYPLNAEELDAVAKNFNSSHSNAEQKKAPGKKDKKSEKAILKEKKALKEKTNKEKKKAEKKEKKLRKKEKKNEELFRKAKKELRKSKKKHEQSEHRLAEACIAHKKAKDALEAAKNQASN